MTVVVDGTQLTIEDVVAVARRHKRVQLAAAARAHMASTHAVVEEALVAGDPVYGLTTGVAERKRVLLEPAERRLFSQRLVLSHRVAQGAARPIGRRPRGDALPGQWLREGHSRRSA